MKYIEKSESNQPLSLRQHKAKPHSNYGNYDEKNDLRDVLLKEQGYLCCYCMQTIRTYEKMKIEHFKPYSVYNGKNGKEDLTLVYSNLLAVCCESNTPKHLVHCDVTKQNKEIKLNPTKKQLMDLIKFGSNGKVYTENETYDKEIDEILNLNTERLKKERESICKTIEYAINKEFKNKTVTKSFLNENIKKWERQYEGKYNAYCQVAIFYLQKKLAKAIDN